MNLTPLFDAPLAVQVHVAAVIPAALLGPPIFWARKGTRLHRLFGKVWLGLMVAAALSSFFIHGIDLFLGLSPIHLLSAYILYGSWKAVSAARAHRIREHKRNLIGMYVGGILVAGGLTLLPGRLMHAVFFAWPAEWPDMTRLSAFVILMAGFVLALAILSALVTRPRAGRESLRT